MTPAWRTLAFIALLQACAHAASQIQISFDSGSQSVFDAPGQLLSPGSAADGDGSILQLGYYDAATAASPFSGAWHPLTGAGSLNTGGNTGSGLAFNTTSIGDIGGGAAPGGSGIYGFSLLFDSSVAGTFNDLPAATTIPLAIRFYDGASLARSSYFNAVSNAAWLWKLPATPAPLPPTLNLSLDDPGLQWQSIAVSGQSASTAFHTSIAIVPEPSTAILAALGFVAFRLRRRRSARRHSRVGTSDRQSACGPEFPSRDNQAPMKTKLHRSAVLLLTLLCELPFSAVPSLHAQTVFTVDDLRVGSTSVGYIDPEFLPEHSRLVFQEAGTRNVYVSLLNPDTGLLFSADGKDLLVDTNIATLGAAGLTFNGPEWGLDSAGPAIFYEKLGGNGLVQVWRAEGVLAGPVQIQQLTTNAAGATTKLVRKDATRPTTKLVHRQTTSAVGSGPLVWLDESDAAQSFTVPGFAATSYQVAWIPGTEDFVYVRFTSATTTELARYHTATRTATVLTAEPGAKKNPAAFYAPELGGELVLSCVLDSTDLVFFRFNGTAWTRWTSLTVPDAARPYLYSPEIFQVGGMTWFAVLMQNVNAPEGLTDGAIYVVNLGTNAAQRLIRRVDDGAVTGLPLLRNEPEPFEGTNEVFVYYSVNGGGPAQLRRARTGIFQQPAPALQITAVANGTAQLASGLTQPGFRYQLEDSATLSTGSWLPLGAAVPGDGASHPFAVNVAGETRHFFRLRQTQLNP